MRVGSSGPLSYPLLFMNVDALIRGLPPGVRLRGTRYDSTSASTWEKWLSEEERDCVSEFGAAVRRREFVTGRAAARTLLADVLEVSPGSVPLRQAEDGGVDVERDEWHVSISHSAEHAVAACARHLIGVDLEQIKPRDEGIARFLLHPQSLESGLLDDLPYERTEALILCWTLKEAVLKARRSGFRRSPKTLRLEVSPDRQRASVHVQDGRLWAARYKRMDDFILSVAFPEDQSGPG